MLKDLKEFLMKGNVVDLAVGVVVGGAFGKIVTSLVNDIIMPTVSLLTGGMDIKGYFIPLNGKDYTTLADAEAAKIAVMKIGMFGQTVLDFIIIGTCIFFVVKAYEKLRHTEEALPQEPTTQEKLLADILDTLKKK